MSWDDEEGKKYADILTNACYMPESPFNVFSATEFGKFIDSNDHEDLLDSTSIQAFARHSVFK